MAASVLAVIAAAEVVLMRKTLLVDFGAILTMVGALVMTLPVGLWDAIQAPVVLHRSSLLYIFVILMLLHTVIAKNKFSFEDAGVFTLTMMYVGMGFGMMVVMIIISIVLSVAGQFGDLIESGLKRFYKVKDSGNVLPGHGGILDRFDSMLIVLPLMYLIGLFH